MRRFKILWQSAKKYPKNLPTAVATVEIINETGDIGIDAHSALNVFCRQYGSLKYINVILIQEIDENNNNIGEPILPQDNAIIPTGR